MRTGLQRAGGFLAGMVVPNIAAFIAWGLITALFIPAGWAPNPRLARLVDPMILVLLPVLIGFTGGRLVHGLRGGVVGAVATMGVVAGSVIPMFIGAMVMGPLGGLAVRWFDRFADRRVPVRGFSSFVSDPARPVDDPQAADPGAHDYRQLVERKDMAAFDTAPFESDLRVVGRIRVEMHVSTGAKDVDFWVKLFDVAPNGTAFNLMSPGLDVLRASYRDGGPRRRLLRPGRVYALRFENPMTGNTFRRGHRLRLVVCGAFFPHFSRNLQTGALESVSAASRPALIRVNHSARYPSHLVLPVVPGS